MGRIFAEDLQAAVVGRMMLVRLEKPSLKAPRPGNQAGWLLTWVPLGSGRKSCSDVDAVGLHRRNQPGQAAQDGHPQGRGHQDRMPVPGARRTPVLSLRIAAAAARMAA